LRDPAPAAPAAADIQRFARHLALPGIGAAGQERLHAARMVIVGMGGLGSPAALYLAAAGVGSLVLVDDDRVDVTNLQRQVLHSTADVGRLKVESARDRLLALDPAVQIDAHALRFDAENADVLLAGATVVIDGSDNFATRYAVSDACVRHGIPLVHGSVLRWEGQATVLIAGNAPCYRCLFPDAPPPGVAPDCASGGVLGALPGIVGSIQAAEAVKLVLGATSDTLAGRLLLVDARRMHFSTIDVRRDPACPACGDRVTTHVADDGVPLASMSDECTPAELAGRLARGETVELLDVREPAEWAIARLPGARLVPLATLDATLGSLDPLREIVVYCHHGVRSQWAVLTLRDAGFAHARNMTGGIDRWSREVDASVPRY